MLLLLFQSSFRVRKGAAVSRCVYRTQEAIEIDIDIVDGTREDGGLIFNPPSSL